MNEMERIKALEARVRALEERLDATESLSGYPAKWTTPSAVQCTDGLGNTDEMTNLRVFRSTLALGMIESAIMPEAAKMLLSARAYAHAKHSGCVVGAIDFCWLPWSMHTWNYVDAQHTDAYASIEYRLDPLSAQPGV